MAENVKIIKTVIQVRRDTEANWLLNSSIVPAAGEPCLTLDGKHACQVKFGDGVRSWGELPYTGVGEFQGDGKTIVIENNVIGIVGADTATAGQGFRISADGISIEWFTPAAQEEVVSLKEIINSTQTEVVSLKDIMNSTQGTVANLQELVAGKANASEVYTKDEVDAMVSGAFRYCGTVADMEELEAIVEPKQGDVYQVTEDALMMVFDGDSWEEFGDTIDLSGYMTIEEANEALHKVKYEIAYKPTGTLVDYREKEIRVMCPADTQWVKQAVGSTGNANMYYMGFKAYAPEGAVSFKEDDQATIADQTMYYFENNDFAGIDKYGRKYSIVWLALASYDEATDTWSYFGAQSTDKKYIGWYYTVEWYDANGIVIASDKIRINLTNESCHSEIKPYWVSDILDNVVTDLPTADDDTLGVVKSAEGDNMVTVNEDGTMQVKSISWSSVVQAEGETIIMDGGGAAV